MREIVGGLLQYKDGNTWKDIPALVGKTGDKGDIGNTPSLSIGTVTALDTGETPTATLTGTTDAPVLNLGLPRGLTGEVTEQELDDALKLKGDCFTDTASGSIASFSDGADDTPIKGMTVDIVPTETGTGTKSAENPWTIGGWASAKLHCTGKNLLGGTDLRDEIQTNYPAIDYDEEEQYLSASASGLSGKTLVVAPFKIGLQYTIILSFYKSSGIGSNLTYEYTDNTTANLSTATQAGEIETKATVSSATKSVNRIRGNNQSGSTRIYYMNTGIFLGEKTVSDYEAYKGKTIPLTFGSTIYGGQISIAQDGTVKLKVYPYYSSYNGEELTGKWVSSMDEYVAGATPTTGAFVVDLSGQYTEEITLTPITPIKTLLGVNNLWADCGDVSVQYRADTKLYIDRKVASLV